MGFHAGGGDLYDEDSVLCSVERGVSDILRLFVATQQLKGFVIGYLKIRLKRSSLNTKLLLLQFDTQHVP